MPVSCLDPAGHFVPVAAPVVGQPGSGRQVVDLDPPNSVDSGFQQPRLPQEKRSRHLPI